MYGNGERDTLKLSHFCHIPAARRPIARRRWAHDIVVVALALLLAACEAPLRLQGVEQSLGEPIWRGDLFQAAATAGQAIVVVGNHGLILHSSDGGVSWGRHELPEWPSLIDVTACGDGLIAALAIEGEVWTSTDGGATWTEHLVETEEAPQAITCDRRDRLWVVGSFSTIMSSADDGATWTDVSLGDDVILNAIQFFDDEQAIVLGEFGTVIKTSDGGATWEHADPLPDEFYPLAVWFDDPDTGWVAGLGGRVLHTTDGGATWERQPTPTLVPLYGLARSGGALYAVGGEGTLLKLEAERWVRVDHGKPIRLFLRAILPLGEDRLLVGGRAGALYVLPITDLPVIMAQRATGS